MVLYLSIIFVAMAIISALNIIFGTPIFGYSIAYVILAVLFCTIVAFVIDGVGAIIINKLPNSWFGVDNKHYNVSKRSIKFYEKIKIRKWKDKVWELGGLGGFRKNKIKDPKDPAYIERFIIECNKGVLTHRLSYVTGFAVMFVLPLQYAFVIGLPVALVNLFLNILPTMVLRYNTPKLKALYKRLKSEKEKIRKEEN